MGKKLIEKKFHSKEILPVMLKGKSPADVEAWIESSRNAYRFTEGEEVVHIHNTDQAMIVSKIVRKEKGTIDGIECHWWANE